MYLFPLVPVLHFLSALALILGVLFLLFWTFKHFTEGQLKRWGWILVILGLIGSLLTMGFTRSWMQVDGNDPPMMKNMMGDGLNMMRQDDSAQDPQDLENLSGDDF